MFNNWLVVLAVYLSYTFKSIFGPEEKSKIIDHKTLNKTTIEAILNEIFTTDVNENEQVIERFNEEYDL